MLHITTWQLYHPSLPILKLSLQKSIKWHLIVPWLLRILSLWPGVHSSPQETKKTTVVFISSPKRKLQPADRPLKAPHGVFPGVVWLGNVGNGLDGLHTHRFPPKKRIFGNGTWKGWWFFSKKLCIKLSSGIPDSEKVANTTSSNRFMNRSGIFRILLKQGSTEIQVFPFWKETWSCSCVVFPLKRRNLRCVHVALPSLNLKYLPWQKTVYCILVNNHPKQTNN